MKLTSKELGCIYGVASFSIEYTVDLYTSGIAELANTIANKAGPNIDWHDKGYGYGYFITFNGPFEDAVKIKVCLIEFITYIKTLNGFKLIK